MGTSGSHVYPLVNAQDVVGDFPKLSVPFPGSSILGSPYFGKLPFLQVENQHALALTSVWFVFASIGHAVCDCGFRENLPS